MREVVRINKVYKSVNAPLTLMGVERRLFFLSVMMGGCVWLGVNTLLSGVLVFGLCYLVARRLTATDPEMIAIGMRSVHHKAQYDPAKFTPVPVVRIHDA